MEDLKSNAGQGMGIAGLVLGIIAIMICFIPCVGIMAIVPGLVGVTLSAIAYNQAVKGNGARGLIIAALVISILGSSVALMQGLGLSYLKNHEDVFDRVGHKIEKEVDKIDENFEDAGNEMEKVLEQLENVDDSIHIDIKVGKKLNDEEFDKFLKDYESLIKQTARLAKQSKSGEEGATINYSKLALKLAAVHAKILGNMHSLTAEQQKKLEKLNKKYEKELQAIEE